MRRLIVTLVLVGSAAVVTRAATPADSDSVEVKQHRSAVAVQQVSVTLPGLRDEAAMVLVGTVLIGLGAAVRRSA